MSEFLTEPATFGAAARWLRERATLPLGLSSDQIANQIPANIRMRSFFSATITKASTLEDFRKEIDALLKGDTTLAYARERLMNKVEAAGYETPGAGEAGDGDVTKLGSYARINLILNQNVRMAQAIGSREVSEHPAVMEAFPNYKYHANTDRHAKFDGLVLPKSDPFWQTHYPPWEFNCRCIVTDEPGEPNASTKNIETHDDGTQSVQLQTPGGTVDVPRNESGFVFQSKPSDLWRDFNTDGISDPSLRQHVGNTLFAHRQALGLEPADAPASDSDLTTVREASPRSPDQQIRANDSDLTTIRPATPSAPGERIL